MPSLLETEKALAALWLNEECRNWYLKEHSNQCHTEEHRLPGAARPDQLAAVDNAWLEMLDAEGVQLYGKLLSFGHADVMDAIYPYCRQILADDWAATIADYLEKFPATHYNFNRLCQRLSDYFTEYGGSLIQRYPFLADLADYEWAELAVQEMDVELLPASHQPLSQPEHFTAWMPMVNPTLSLRPYRYDVCAIAASLDEGDNLECIKPEATCVAIYRQGQNQLCRIVQLDEAAIPIVQAAFSPSTYQQLLQLYLGHAEGISPQQAVMDFLDLVEELQDISVFVGSRSA